MARQLSTVPMLAIGDLLRIAFCRAVMKLI